MSRNPNSPFGSPRHIWAPAPPLLAPIGLMAPMAPMGPDAAGQKLPRALCFLWVLSGWEGRALGESRGEEGGPRTTDHILPENGEWEGAPSGGVSGDMDTPGRSHGTGKGRTHRASRG